MAQTRGVCTFFLEFGQLQLLICRTSIEDANGRANMSNVTDVRGNFFGMNILNI